MACAVLQPPSPVEEMFGRRPAEPSAGLPFLPATLDRLATAAADLRRFLARVHFAHETVPGMMPGALYHPTEAFDLAKARYEHVWMPLLASENSASPRKLAAPLDVQWMHHLHRLDPDAYRVDCERAFGRLVDPADPFLVAGDGAPSEDRAAESFARAAWNTLAPEWPFDLEDALIDHRRRGGRLPRSRALSSFDSSSCDMVGSATRQGGFLWQVLPCETYGDEDFIRRAVRRYAMLVGLWRDFPGEFLVPTYDQDLVWHAHLSVPSVYEKEMRTATYRHAIGHDDSVNDRTPGAKLEVRGRRTMELWRTHYPVSAWDEPYARTGAMWRGDAPDWYWTCQFPRPIPPSRAPGPVTEGSQRTPAVELAPNVFYAPPSGNPDYTSMENEKSGWLGIFEGTVPPPFGRAVDPGVQYVKVKVLCAGTTELCRDDDEGAWLRFRVPKEIFPPEFIADVGRRNRLSLITTLSFQLPHCENYLYATFITPVDIRHVIAQYQSLTLSLDWFCCGLIRTNRQQKLDYGLGPAPAREPPMNTVGGGCGAACGAGGGNIRFQEPADGSGCGGGCGGGGCGGGGCGGD